MIRRVGLWLRAWLVDRWLTWRLKRARRSLERAFAEQGYRLVRVEPEDVALLADAEGLEDPDEPA